jgi:hypothetical protein
MRLVNLYAGDEKTLTFAEDVSTLLAHVEETQGRPQWELVEHNSNGISQITAGFGGKSLSEGGIRGIQQLSCKVRPSLPPRFVGNGSSWSIRLLWSMRHSTHWG